MSTEKIVKIETYEYNGPVYNLEVEPNHPIKDDQYYIDNRSGIVVHNCHPRDNIALRYMSQQLGLKYDIFHTVMEAREQQARNIADYLKAIQDATDLPIIIHGKAYKPDVDLVDGSYSLLIGNYLTRSNSKFCYVDPLTGDAVNDDTTAIVLLAHNRKITYGYTGMQNRPEQELYFKLGDNSIVVDPWREFTSTNESIKIIHYGNTRISQ